jgi:hypothetical protein
MEAAVDIPQHVWARGYERNSPTEPLFGRYIRIDLSGRPDLRSTFDTVVQLVQYGQQAAEVVPFARVAWAVVIYGVEPHDLELIERVKSEYVAMWERHPDVWPQLQPREVVFSVWFVDQQSRPFMGCVCDEAPWDLWVSGRDVRQERVYQKMMSEGQAPILMALNAVHEAELGDAWGGPAA